MKIMWLTFKLRLNPTKEQVDTFRQYVGASRFVWNALIDAQEQLKNSSTGGYMSSYAMSAYVVQMKKVPGLEWLKDISHHTLIEVTRDLNTAYKEFFKRRRGHPKFKSKKTAKQTFHSRSDRFHFVGNNAVHLDKIGTVQLKSVAPQHLLVAQKYSNVVITYQRNKWLLHVAVDCKSQAPTGSGTMGIDVGIKTLATTYMSGLAQKYDFVTKTDKYRQSAQRLKQLNRVLSRKLKCHAKGTLYSRNTLRYIELLRKAYAQQANRRLDCLHQISKKIIQSNNPACIVMEHLDIAQMRLDIVTRKYVSEIPLYQFRKIMTYKSQLYGVTFRLAAENFASTRICSTCGFQMPKLNLSLRVFHCDKCNTLLDRDVNAAINLANYS